MGKQNEAKVVMLQSKSADEFIDVSRLNIATYCGFPESYGMTKDQPEIL